VENVTAKFNRSTTPTTTDDMKVENIFESKVNYYKKLPSGPLSVKCHSHL